MRRAGDVPAAIQWHDGMLLSPQHFQESARRFERLLDYHALHAAPYHYGVRHMEIDAGLLVSGTLRVLEMEAVMPDNLLVRHTAHDPDLELDLRPHVPEIRGGQARVYLAVAREHLGGVAAGGDLARYRSVEGVPVVDDNTGDEPMTIPRLVPLARLLVAAEPPARFVCLPLARLRMDGEAFARTDYLPPALSVSISSPLGKLCSQIIARLREKALRLAEKLGALSLTTDRDLIAELRRQIHALVAGLPAFEALLYTDQSHPYPLFVALAGLVGQLAALSRTPVPPVLPAYRHDDVFAVFQTARDHLFRLVDEGILESFTAHPLAFEQGRYRVEFSREWGGRQVLLAVKGRRGAQEGEVLDWMEGALIGALKKARDMQQSRVLGAARRRIDRHGDLIPPSGTFLFEVEEASPYIDVGEPLVVFNTADPAAATGPAEIVLYVKSTE